MYDTYVHAVQVWRGTYGSSRGMFDVVDMQVEWVEEENYY